MPPAFKVGQAPWETGQPQSFPVGQAPWETASSILTPDQISAQKYNPFVPAVTGEGVLPSAGKTLANIPSSAINFLKGAVSFFNPVNVGKTISQIPSEFSGLVKEAGGVLPALIKTAKELPHTTYESLIPEATRQIISGDTIGAQRTLENDPVGQILPYLLVARGAAEKAGKGAEFDQAISQVASPVTKTASFIGSKVSQGIGALGSQILGAETGAGASSIKTALSGGEQFRAAMRGQITPEETVNQLQDAFNTIKETRATEYRGKLVGIEKQIGSLDISPIQNELNIQLKNFRVKEVDAQGKLDFSRSTISFDKSAQADVQHIYDTMKDYGTVAGDRTPIAVDSLKRAFGDLYSPSSNVRAFTTAMKNSARDILNKNVPGYEAMTKGYSTASNLLNEIRSATSLGGKANADTVFTKVTTALKADKEFRLQMLNELENGAGVKLIDALAGHNLSKWIPTGLIGKGIDISTAYGIIAHVFNPSMIPLLLSTSPRLVGEFLGAVGVGKQYVAPILQAINKLPEISQNINITGVKNKIGLTIQDVSGKNPVKSPLLEKPQEILSSSNPTIIPKELQPLAQEARKYKSAEEFVKAQGNPVYHFTDKGNVASIEKGGIRATAANSDTISEGISVATKRTETNAQFGNAKVPVYISPEAKTITIKDALDKMGFANETDIGVIKNVETKAPAWAAKNGYDVLDMRDARGAIYKGMDEIRVLNPDILKTKSQLNTIWNQANKTKALDPKNFKSAEEFVKAQGQKVFRGGSSNEITEKGLSVSTNENVAKTFAMARKGTVGELYISPNAKIVDIYDIPTLSKDKAVFDYNKANPPLGDKGFMSAESKYQIAAKWAKDNGYDAVKLPTEGEIRVVNPDVLKTKSQLTDIFNKANAGKEVNPLIAEARKYKSAEEFVKGKYKTFDDLTSLGNDMPKGKKDALFELKTKPINELSQSDFIESYEWKTEYGREMFNDIKSGKKLSPIPIDKNGTILDGNHRYEIYQKLGVKNVEVFEEVNQTKSQLTDFYNQVNKLKYNK